MIRTFGEPGKFCRRTGLYLYTKDRRLKFWAMWGDEVKPEDANLINLATTERTYGPQSDFDEERLAALRLKQEQQLTGAMPARCAPSSTPGLGVWQATLRLASHTVWGSLRHLARSVPNPADESPGFEALPLRLSQLRAERGWTYDDLAEKSGVSRATLVTIETGASRSRRPDAPSSRGLAHRPCSGRALVGPCGSPRLTGWGCVGNFLAIAFPKTSFSTP